MESKTFVGKDQYDVDQQIWNWRNTNPHIKIVKTYPAVDLGLPMKTPVPNYGPIASPQDRVSVKIDYETSN